MKIKNRKKFITAITILGLIVFFIIILTTKTFSKVEYTSKIIYASTGDTLWEIASQEQECNLYYEGKNVRQIIDDIKNINNLNNSYIYEGQKLEIPTL